MSIETLSNVNLNQMELIVERSKALHFIVLGAICLGTLVLAGMCWAMFPSMDVLLRAVLIIFVVVIGVVLLRGVAGQPNMLLCADSRGIYFLSKSANGLKYVLLKKQMVKSAEIVSVDGKELELGLSSEDAESAEGLKPKSGYWAIENGRHYLRFPLGFYSMSNNQLSVLRGLVL